MTILGGTRLCTRIAITLFAVFGTQFCFADVRAPQDEPIIVHTSAELLAALNDTNAGRHIRLLRGTYTVDRPLTIPNGATVVGDGIMRFDGDSTPRGFEPGTETIIEVTSGFTGNVLTFGNDAAIRGLSVRDLPDDPSGVRRIGNIVIVASRAPGDVLAASISECEIFAPNPSGFADAGPTGHGLLAMTRDAIGSASPDDGAAVTVRVERTIIHAADESGGVFVINFASRAKAHIMLSHNLLEGALVATGGVNRLHEVTFGETIIESDHNRYVSRVIGNDNPGWRLYGGSSPPHHANVNSEGLRFNTLRIRSVGDRIDGFFVGILAVAGRRVLPATGSVSDNVLDLDLRDLHIRTSGTGAADLRLCATLSEQKAELSRGFDVGDRNTVRIRIDGANGSGARANEYAMHCGPPLPGNRDEDNRIEVRGKPAEFLRSNTGIEPAPPPEYFVDPGIREANGT